VYKLAFRSNKPEADAFTNWVASEVLPAIRKTGGYRASPKQPALPSAEPAPDADDRYLHIREDLEMVTRIMDALVCDARVYLPKSGLWSQMEILRRVASGAGRVVACLYDARDHLRETNRFALMLRSDRR
jgi:hypothetical protein